MTNCTQTSFLARIVRPLRLAPTLILGLGLSACTSQSPFGPGTFPTPRGKVVDLNWDQFNQWKGLLIKSCSLEEALGSTLGPDLEEAPEEDPTGPHQGVDEKLLLEASQNSGVLSRSWAHLVFGGSQRVEGSGEFSIQVRDPNSPEPSGVKNLVFRQNAGHCLVSLDGELIYETHLAAKVDVVALLVDRQSYEDEYDYEWIAEVTTDALLNGREGQSMAALQFSHSSQLFAQVFNRWGYDYSPHEFLESFFPQLDYNDIENYFNLSSTDFNYVDVMRLASGMGWLWSRAQENQLYGPPANLSEILEQASSGSASFSLEWILRPQLSLSQLNPNYSTQPLLIQMQLRLQAIEGDEETQPFRLTITGLRTSMYTGQTELESQNCFVERAFLLKDFYREDGEERSRDEPDGDEPDDDKPAVLQPSLREVIEPCENLAPNNRLLLTRDQREMVLADIFADLIPESGLNYQGWDQALLTASSRYFDQPAELRQRLNPQGGSLVLQNLTAALEQLQGMDSNSEDFQTQSRWAFDVSLKAPETIDFAMVFSALDNAQRNFPELERPLLSRLQFNPAEAVEDFVFVNSLTAEDAAAAQTALAKASEINLDGWREDYFGQMLFKRTRGPEWRAWTALMEEIQEDLQEGPQELSGHPHLSRALFEARAQQGQSRLWTRSFLTAVKALAPSYTPALDQLLRTMARSWDESVPDSIAFMSQLNEGYTQKFHQLQSRAQDMDLAEWEQALTSELLSRRPSAESLSQWMQTLDLAQALREELSEEQRQQPGWRQRSYLPFMNRALEESWSEAEFQTLQQLMSLNGLEGHPCQSRQVESVFSLASCLPQGILSRQPERILSPEFQGRYGELAAELAEMLSRFDPSHPSPWLESQLSRALFSPDSLLWSQHNRRRFADKSRQLFEVMSRLADERNPRERRALETQAIQLLN